MLSNDFASGCSLPQTINRESPDNAVVRPVSFVLAFQAKAGLRAVPGT